MSTNGSFGRLKLIAALLIAIGIVVGAGVVVGQAPAIFGADVADDPEASIAFEDQERDGSSVEVDAVSLSDGGFVVVTDERDQVIAVSEHLEAGAHENLTVEPGDDEDAELLGRLTATVYQDRTEDGEFRPDPDDEDEAGDRPYVVDGYPVAETAAVTTGDRTDDAPADSFVVGDLEGPTEATTTQTAEFVAVVSNPTDAELRQHVEFRIDGGLYERQVFTLQTDESREVSFEVDVADVGEGNYTYGVYTAEDGTHGELEVEYDGPPSLSVTDANESSVSVDVGLPDGGFVAVEDEDGAVAGTSDELDAGVHENLTVEIADVADDENVTAVAYEGDPDDVEGASAYEDEDGERIAESIDLAGEREE
ncbi:hypothetical protein [Halovivax sp.]|uniref:DUF7282 domain-containing protein n=1 Tax=Halovivax sp. TaxID=1935978 RepID=UPI0025BDB344|nr:hypothetical protein [Halovivax sp.]